MNSAMQPHADITEDVDGTKHAISSMHQVTVLPDGETRVFNRNGLVNALGSETNHVRWLVAVLDDVRVYINGSRIIVTKQDLYP